MLSPERRPNSRRYESNEGEPGGQFSGGSRAELSLHGLAEFLVGAVEGNRALRHGAPEPDHEDVAQVGVYQGGEMPHQLKN